MSHLRITFDRQIAKAFALIGMTKDEFAGICMQACLEGKFDRDIPYEYRIKTTESYTIWAVGKSNGPADIQFDLDVEFNSEGDKESFINQLAKEP
jgi:hypothetical protein